MLGVTQQQQGGVPQGGIMSSNAGTLGESCSDMSALTSIFKPLSPEPPQTPGKTKIAVGDSINQRCDLMLSEQLSHLQDIQSALEETLDTLEREEYSDYERYVERAKNLFEQAQNGSVLVSCIGKMQSELLHTRQDLQQLMASSDRDELTRVQDRVRWLENRIEQVLLMHRQSVLEGKRAKMTSSLAHSTNFNSSTSDLKSGDSVGKVGDSVYNMVSLGPLPFTEDSIGREDTTATTKSLKSIKSIKSVRSQKSKAASTATRFTVPSTSRSEDHPESSLWSKRSGPQPLWHTLPLVPRSPITLSCVPFNREVPWLDRRGSSYDLLREEYSQLMDKVGKVYTHIQSVVDSSHETDVNINSPTNVSSRMSRQGGEGKDDYDCYGLEPPGPLKWGRLSRSQSNIYPRPTRTWHNGVYLEPVRRIANQQQQQSMSRQSTFTSGSKSESIRIFSRAKLAKAKARVKFSVLASVSLQRLNKQNLSSRQNDELSSGVAAAQKERIMFLINNNLRSEIDKVRKEAVRDLGILYKTRPDFAIVNALKETVYTDDNIFVLIDASKSLLSIGVWDSAALEIVLQAIKYGSQGLRFTLLETLRKSSNPNSVNKQSVQFRVLQGLLLNLIRRGSHVVRTQVDKGPTFTLPTDTPSLLLKLQKEKLGSADNDTLAAHAALVCAAFLITDAEVEECLLHLLREGTEDLQSWSLGALVTKLNHHSADVIRSCLSQMKSAVKTENRAAAAELIVDLKQAIEKNGLSQMVFDGLQLMLYDDCSREVRQTVAKVITSLGLHAKMLQVVVRKLDDINEDVRGQAVMSLSILGIKGKSLLNQLLDILELDSSIFVRIQVMRAVKELNIADRRVVRLLRERARGTGPMCKEAQLALYSLTGETE